MTEPPHLHVSVLGGLSVRCGHTALHLPRNQRSTLLATLLCRPGRAVEFSVLAEELGTSKANVQKSRAKLLNDLSALAPGAAEVIQTTADGYRIRPDLVTIDADRFVRLATVAERTADSDLVEAVSICGDALAMWAEPFAGIAIGPIASDHSVDLEEARLRLVRVKAGALLDLGDHRGSIGPWRELREANPFDESVCHGLVRALVAVGERHEALDVFAELGASYRERGWVMSAAMSRLEADVLTDALTFEPSSFEPVEGTVATRTQRVVSPAELLSGRTTGHRRELAEIERVAAAALRSGPAAVFVEGEAGIGKTWLLEEFAATGADRSFRVVSVEFLEDQVPGPQVVLEAARTAIGELDAERAAALTLEELPAALLDAAGDRPLAILADDLQWADDRTLEQLDHLLRLASRPGNRSSQLFVLGAHRPASAATALAERLDRAKRHRCVRSVALRGLEDLDIHGLFRSMGLARPDPFAMSLLREATGGNPLALRRALTMLTTRGALVEEAGLTTIDVGDAPSLDQISTTELARTRIADLDVEQRDVALAVAVLGDHASIELTEALLAEHGAGSGPLTDLIGLGVLRDRGGRLQFDHPTTSSALLADADDERSRRMHLAAAAVIASTVPRSSAALRWEADHLIRARADEGDWVRRACAAAGEGAMSAASWSEADRYFAVALDAARPSSTERDLLDLKLRRAHAAFRDHQTSRAAELFAEAATYGRLTGDLRLWGEGLVNRGRSTVHDLARFAPDHERDELERFVEASRGDPTLAGRRAEAYQRLAIVSWTMRQYPRAELEAELALVDARRAGDRTLEARAAMTLGLARQDSFDLLGAIDAFETSTAAGDATDSTTFVDWGRARAARVNWMLGHLETAIEQAALAADRAERVANWAEASLARTNLAGALHAAGDGPASAAEAGEALRLYVRSRYRWVGATLLPLAHHIAIDGGDARLVDELDALDDPTHPAGVLCRGIRALHLDDVDALADVASVLRERCAGPLTPRLAEYSVGAAVARRVSDGELAGACLRALTDPRLERVRFVPGTNHLRRDDIERCRLVLGEPATP